MEYYTWQGCLILKQKKLQLEYNFMDYDIWKTSPPYYYHDADSPKCSECTDMQQKFDDAKEFLEGVCEQLYGIETFCREDLNFFMEELCSRLNVRMSEKELKIHSIKAKEDKIFNFTLDLSKKLAEPKFITI